MCIVCKKVGHALKKNVASMLHKAAIGDPTVLRDLVKDVRLDDVVHDVRSLGQWLTRRLLKAKNLMSRAISRRHGRSKRSTIDYKTHSIPAARSTSVRIKAPVMHSSKGKLLLRGSEQIAAVNNSIAFDCSRYSINPGMPLFTAASSQADHYQRYTFRKLVFRYVPSDGSTGTKGTVYLALNYDPEEAVPSDLKELSTYTSMVNTRVYETKSISLSRKDAFSDNPFKKVRCGPVGSNLNAYDTCLLLVARKDGADTGAIGNIWVDYEIEFQSRYTRPSTFYPTHWAWWAKPGTQAFPATGVWGNMNFATERHNPMGIVNNSGVYTVPCGAFLVNIRIAILGPGQSALIAQVRVLVDGVEQTDATSSRMVYFDPLAPSSDDSLSTDLLLAGASSSTLEVQLKGVYGAGGPLFGGDNTTIKFISVD